MCNLLLLSTYGLKNIENEVSIEFANMTIEKGVNKLNRVKGIFGYNGSGKSALIASIALYQKINLRLNYLIDSKTKNLIHSLINLQKKEFYISMTFDAGDKLLLRHSMKLKLNNTFNDYVISEESISQITGRTLNENIKILIQRKDDEIICDNDIIKNEISFLSKIDLNYNSMLLMMVREITNKKEENLTYLENIILKLYECVNSINVSLSDSEFFDDVIGKLNVQSINKKEDYSYIINDGLDDIVKKNDFKKYQDYIKHLNKFIQIFKPELKEIKLDKRIDRDIYHIGKIFQYQDYSIDLEFESSGIRQLVRLFPKLIYCANGGIVFIDEIDANIHGVYLEKMISFFKEYGKGQLIFTLHDINCMNALKSEAKSITSLGVENKLYTWVAKGSRSPVNDYIAGNFDGSPMNIEDFDFLSVFFGDEND